MDNNYGDIPRNPVGYGILSLFCGVLGTVIVFTASDYSAVSVALGAIGMVMGGFAFSLASRFPTDDRVQFMGLAAVGILTSVIAFMFGLVNWVG